MLKTKFLEKGYQPLELEDAIRGADERIRDDLLVPRIRDRDDSFRFFPLYHLLQPILFSEANYEATGVYFAMTGC